MPDSSVDGKVEGPSHGLAWQVSALAGCRLILNTARRFAYPFAPVLGRGLGVPLTWVTAMIAVNQATALLGIFLGPAADRFGYRLMMLVGLGMLIIGMFAAGFIPCYGTVMAGFFLAGLAKTIFDPAVQAYIGERVSFHRRGFVIGLVEFSWAGSTLAGIPLVAVMIDRFGWRSPFFLLGGFGLLGCIAIRLRIPSDGRAGNPRGSPAGIWKTWRRVMDERSAVGAIGFAFFSSIANDNLFVVYGAWLEKTFSVSVLALGLGTGIIGLAELTGESLTAVFSDRLGLKRSAIAGQILCVIAYSALPVSGFTLTAALCGLFVIFLIYEFTIVTSLSLCTELMPAFRATMMSCFFAAAGSGRVLGALIGGHAWLKGGIQMTGMVSAFFSGLGLIFLVWGLRGWEK